MKQGWSRQRSVALLSALVLLFAARPAHADNVDRLISDLGGSDD